MAPLFYIFLANSSYSLMLNSWNCTITPVYNIVYFLKRFTIYYTNIWHPQEINSRFATGWNHLSKFCNIRPAMKTTSPTATEHIGERGTVLTGTKVHLSSRIHMPILVLFNWSENEASKLHFRRLCCEHCHLTETILLVVVGEGFRVVLESPCLTGVVDVVRSLPVLLALLKCCRILFNASVHWFSLIHRFSSKLFVTIKTHCVSIKNSLFDLFNNFLSAVNFSEYWHFFSQRHCNYKNEMRLYILTGPYVYV